MPLGSLSLNSLPLASFRVSVIGLNFKLPAMVMARTSSGEVTKACVAGLASLRPVKLRLYEETMVLASPFLTSRRSH